ncbi:MAG TPA: PilZ domain-containing protein [Terracidiphilus sp.]|nr:PilZ domain-containing protein [Terracidiphilus sp.]
MFQKLGEPPQPRADRLAAHGLEAALCTTGSDSTPVGVKDISASGIYLATEKQLPTGELFTLTLREEATPEDNSELQISVQAKFARQGEDGVGLVFVLPPGLDPHLWEVLVRNIVSLTDKDQVARMFRTLRTILFLYRLCQADSEEVIVLASEILESDRCEALAGVAVLAEKRLASDPDAARMRAHPKLVAKILTGGSWIEDELTMQLWAGLLVSSCSVDAPDDSNIILADLLTQITPVQAKIFTHACERLLTTAPDVETPPSASVILSPHDMVQLTGFHDPYRNATDLTYLFNLGLVQKLFDFTSYHDVEQFDLTPTRLGLELYQRCQGRHGKLDPSLAESGEVHLRTFFPPPQNFMMDPEFSPLPPPPPQHKN